MSKTVYIVHAVIALALVFGYVVVTLTGHDGDKLFVLLGGYLGGAAVQHGSTAGK